MLKINLDILESIYNQDELNNNLDLKRIAIYTKEDENKLQEIVCKLCVKENNFIFENIRIYEDKKKGINLNSNTMVELLRDIRNNKVDTVLCLDLSYITRDYVELGYFFDELKKYNVKLLSVH